MQKLIILQTFHRFVPTGETRTVHKVGGGTEQHAVERREDFPAGKSVEASSEDAAAWIAAGLAKAVDPASAREKPAREAGAAV